MSGGKFYAAGRFPETRVPRVLNDIYIPRLPPIIDINVKLLAYDNNNERNRVGVFQWRQISKPKRAQYMHNNAYG